MPSVPGFIINGGGVGEESTPVDLSSNSGWTTRNGELGSGTAANDTGAETLTLSNTAAGAQVYSSIGHAPWEFSPVFDIRSRISAFSSALSGDSVQMLFGDAIAATARIIGVTVKGDDTCVAFNESGTSSPAVTVAGAGGGQGWMRIMMYAGSAAACYVGVGTGGLEPDSWTLIGYISRGAERQPTWPIVIWQLNRDAGSGNVTATIGAISYRTS